MKEEKRYTVNIDRRNLESFKAHIRGLEDETTYSITDEFTYLPNGSEVFMKGKYWKEYYLIDYYNEKIEI
jgi:hypothetical protein